MADGPDGGRWILSFAPAPMRALRPLRLLPSPRSLLSRGVRSRQRGDSVPHALGRQRASRSSQTLLTKGPIVSSTSRLSRDHEALPSGIRADSAIDLRGLGPAAIRRRAGETCKDRRRLRLLQPVESIVRAASPCRNAAGNAAQTLGMTSADQRLAPGGPRRGEGHLSRGCH